MNRPSARSIYLWQKCFSPRSHSTKSVSEVSVVMTAHGKDRGLYLCPFSADLLSLMTSSKIPKYNSSLLQQASTTITRTAFLKPEVNPQTKENESDEIHSRPPRQGLENQRPVPCFWFYPTLRPRLHHAAYGSRGAHGSISIWKSLPIFHWGLYKSL
jgi:hypothetical protein